jgi:hypothetical protein
MNYFIHLLLEVSQVHLTRIQKRSKKNTSGTNLKKTIANTDDTKIMKKYTGHVGKFIKKKERKQGLGVFYNFCAT